MKPTLLILAAGMGSRYGGLKQIDAVGPHGEAIIDYSIYDAIRAGFGKVVFVIREELEPAFRERFDDKLAGKIEVAYAYQAVNTPIEGVDHLPERQKPWGTAHAVLVAEHVIAEPFAVINADDYYGISAFAKMADFLTRQAAPDHYSMVGYVLAKTISDHGSVSRGVAQMDADHYLTEVVERHKVRREADGRIYFTDDDGTDVPVADDALVSMNYWGFHPAIFEELRKQFIEFARDNADNPKAEFYIPLVANRLVKEGKARIAVLPSDDQWYGVTYREDKPTVEAAFRQLTEEGKYPAPLWG